MGPVTIRPTLLQARCLHKSGHRIINSSVALSNSSRPERQSYSAFARTTSGHELASKLLIRPPKIWQTRQWQPQPLNGNSAPRFASTTPTPPPVAEVQSDYVPPPITSTPAGEHNMLDEMTPPPVYDHLGFLKEMGLDYGWGPTAFVETLLEHVHIYLATPWWASMGITMLIIRAALFKFYIEAADSSARRQHLAPLLEPINEKVQAAKVEQDAQALKQAWNERNALHKSAGIVWWKSLVPLVQLPLGFGVFRLIRGMSSLPVPGFDTGGLLWISDLTQSDPYFVLPLATAAAYYFTFKAGGEAGNTQFLSKATQRVFLYVLPTASAVFMVAWPSGLQLTFFISAMLAFLQSSAFRVAGIRRLLGIQPLPEPAAPKSPRYQAPSSGPSSRGPRKGLFGDFKGAVSDVMTLGEKISPLSRRQVQTGRLSAAERKHATSYEERRQREFARDAEMNRRSAQARFEREQEQVTMDQDRKERLQRRAEKRAKRNQ